MCVSVSFPSFDSRPSSAIKPGLGDFYPQTVGGVRFHFAYCVAGLGIVASLLRSIAVVATMPDAEAEAADAAEGAALRVSHCPTPDAAASPRHAQLQLQHAQSAAAAGAQQAQRLGRPAPERLGAALRAADALPADDRDALLRVLLEAKRCSEVHPGGISLGRGAIAVPPARRGSGGRSRGGGGGGGGGGGAHASSPRVLSSSDAAAAPVTPRAVAAAHYFYAKQMSANAAAAALRQSHAASPDGAASPAPPPAPQLSMPGSGLPPRPAAARADPRRPSPLATSAPALGISPGGTQPPNGRAAPQPLGRPQPLMHQHPPIAGVVPFFDYGVAWGVDGIAQDGDAAGSFAAVVHALTLDERL